MMSKCKLDSTKQLKEMRRKHMTGRTRTQNTDVTVRARTCGNERRVLLQLRTGQSLLVVQDAGVEDGAGTVALFQSLSLW